MYPQCANDSPRQPLADFAVPAWWISFVPHGTPRGTKEIHQVGHSKASWTQPAAKAEGAGRFFVSDAPAKTQRRVQHDLPIDHVYFETARWWRSM
ncbi:hypothetical protein MRX96_042963 [Rhipicephalus microplus]